MGSPARRQALDGDGGEVLRALLACGADSTLTTARSRTVVRRSLSPRVMQADDELLAWMGSPRSFTRDPTCWWRMATRKSLALGDGKRGLARRAGGHAVGTWLHNEIDLLRKEKGPKGMT